MTPADPSGGIPTAMTVRSQPTAAPTTRRLALCGLALVLAAGCGRGPRGESRSAASERDPLQFWSRPRHGTNFFHERLSRDRFAAAAAYGVELVRLSPSELPTTARDFLIGDADEYRGLVPADLAMLRQALDMADAEGLGLVVTMLSLPGARWRQHNGDATDLRLFRDPAYQAQAVQFWRDLAGSLRGHPALVGYDPYNEPRPEEAMPGSCAERQGTAADINAFYGRLVAAIREVDPRTPIILEPGADGMPGGLECLQPLADPRVLYSVHIYEPWEWVMWRQNPGRVAYGSAQWDRHTLERALAPLHRWATRHHVPASRIFVGEVGIHRRIPGAGRYLEDALDLASDAGWHWAFYAFREDDWDGMDYELGVAPLPADDDGSLRAALRVGDDAGGLRRIQPPFDAIVRALQRE